MNPLKTSKTAIALALAAVFVAGCGEEEVAATNEVAPETAVIEPAQETVVAPAAEGVVEPGADVAAGGVESGADAGTGIVEPAADAGTGVIEPGADAGAALVEPEAEIATGGVEQEAAATAETPVNTNVEYGTAVNNNYPSTADVTAERSGPPAGEVPPPHTTTDMLSLSPAPVGRETTPQLNPDGMTNAQAPTTAGEDLAGATTSEAVEPQDRTEQVGATDRTDAAVTTGAAGANNPVEVTQRQLSNASGAAEQGALNAGVEAEQQTTTVLGRTDQQQVQQQQSQPQGGFATEPQQQSEQQSSGAWALGSQQQNQQYQPQQQQRQQQSDNQQSSGFSEQTSGAMGSAGETVNDTLLTTKVKTALLSDEQANGMSINVETMNGEVMLSGFVQSQREIEQAMQVARNVEGVRNVINNLKVKQQ